MQHRKILLAAGLLLGLSLNAEAALIPYTSAGKSLVYSSVSNITWTQDANLLGTLESTLGYDNVVNAIIAASPIVDLAPLSDTYGKHSISAADFNSSWLGRTTWYGAQAFINYLNSINYGGSHQWSLPGRNIYTRTDGQFAQLFYNELGGTAGGKIPDTANFANEQAFAYWLEWHMPTYASIFITQMAREDVASMDWPLYAWAVSPGQVSATPAAVPLPGAVWMFLGGMMGMLGLSRRKK